MNKLARALSTIRVWILNPPYTRVRQFGGFPVVTHPKPRLRVSRAKKNGVRARGARWAVDDSGDALLVRLSHGPFPLRALAASCKQEILFTKTWFVSGDARDLYVLQALLNSSFGYCCLREDINRSTLSAKQLIDLPFPGFDEYSFTYFVRAVKWARILDLQETGAAHLAMLEPLIESMIQQALFYSSPSSPALCGEQSTIMKIWGSGLPEPSSNIDAYLQWVATNREWIIKEIAFTQRMPAFQWCAAR